MTQEQPLRLHLLRHGPAAAPPGSLLGSTDAPLSGHGLSRLDRLIEPHLQTVTHWFCSPKLRARQTLAYLRDKGCPVSEVAHDDRLREIDFGEWELKTFAEIIAIDPVRVAAWQHYEGFVFPGGEAVAAFNRRIEELLKFFAGLEGSVAAVTHGGVIRAMICAALGLPARSYLLFDVQPASLTVLDLFPGEGGVLRGLNL